MASVPLLSSPLLHGCLSSRHPSRPVLLFPSPWKGEGPGVRVDLTRLHSNPHPLPFSLKGRRGLGLASIVPSPCQGEGAAGVRVRPGYSSDELASPSPSPLSLAGRREKARSSPGLCRGQLAGGAGPQLLQPLAEVGNCRPEALAHRAPHLHDLQPAAVQPYGVQ